MKWSMTPLAWMMEHVAWMMESQGYGEDGKLKEGGLGSLLELEALSYMLELEP